MAFDPPDYFATVHWAQRDGHEGDPQAPLLEIRPGELDGPTTALRRLWAQFQGAVTWETLLGLIGQQMETHELALGSVDLGRWVSTAEGVNLDEIGALVNMPRNGMADKIYRLAIRAEAASLFSSGTLPEILEICTVLVSSQVRVVQRFPASIDIRAPDLDDDVYRALLRILADVPAAGVGALLSTWESTVGTGALGWSSTTGAVTPFGSWSSTTGTDADDVQPLWSTGQPLGGE